MTTINVIRKRTHRIRPGLKFQFDYWMALAVAGLLVLGMLVVYSATFDQGLLVYKDPSYLFRRQMIAMFLGLGGIALILQFDYHVFRRYSVIIMGGALLILVGVLLVGEESFGATRGLYENSYQPSELAKLATILYIAHWISSKGERIRNITYGLIPFAIITGVVSFLIVQQPDLSTAGLIALIAFTLFFVAGATWNQMLIGGSVATAAFFFMMQALPHAAARVQAWQQVLRDPDQAIWQVRQALIALGRGGIFGVGLGESVQKFGILPAAHTDGVFAIIGEELGLVGGLLIIGLLGLLTWRGILAARNARDSYGFLLAMGVTCWLAYQSLMNIAVITAVIPFTGIPLPFLSYGGTSMLFSLLGVGILLNVSRDRAIEKHLRPQPRRKAEG